MIDWDEAMFDSGALSECIVGCLVACVVLLLKVCWGRWPQTPKGVVDLQPQWPCRSRRRVNDRMPTMTPRSLTQGWSHKRQPLIQKHGCHGHPRAITTVVLLAHNPEVGDPQGEQTGRTGRLDQ